VLLSIKPRFADAIMRGEKKVEFRRRLWKSTVDTVVVYSTEPEKRIVGYFSVSFVDLASPTELWRRHGGVGAIGRDEYRTYYAGTTSGVAVGVGRVHRLDKGRELRSITRLNRPPQSFAYLDRTTMSRLHALH
jgi:predicted transcriptional regulator